MNEWIDRWMDGCVTIQISILFNSTILYHLSPTFVLSFCLSPVPLFLLACVCEQSFSRCHCGSVYICFWFNSIHNAYNIRMCVRVYIMILGMMMVQCWNNKNQQENFVQVTLQILPPVFHEIFRKVDCVKKLLWNKFVDDDDNAVNVVSTLLCLYVLYYICFSYIVTILFMYIVYCKFVCVSLSSSWFVYLQSIQLSLSLSVSVRVCLNVLVQIFIFEYT